MKAPVDARLRMWRSIAVGIGDYYFAGWRPALKAASEIESAHNKILRGTIFVQSRQDDTAASLFYVTTLLLRKLDLEINFVSDPGGPSS